MNYGVFIAFVIVTSIFAVLPMRYWAEKLMKRLVEEGADPRFSKNNIEDFFKTWPFFLVFVIRAVSLGVTLRAMGVDYPMMWIAFLWLLMDERVFLPFIEVYNKYKPKGINKRWF